MSITVNGAVASPEQIAQIQSDLQVATAAQLALVESVRLADYPTSPAALPISTAQQAALDARVPLDIANAPQIVRDAFADGIEEAGGLVRFGIGATGAVLRPALAKIRERPSVRDFGAVGDGALHTLAERFNTLAAAKVVYPFATALTQSLDWAGIQAAMNFGIDVTRDIKVPIGKYLLNGDPLATKNVVGLGLRGDSISGSIISQTANNVPVFRLGENVANGYLRDIGLRQLTIQHENAQAGNTGAVAILFDHYVDRAFRITLNEIQFDKSYWGIKTTPGAEHPWGCVWDQLNFGAPYGGCIDATGTVFRVANNLWGRFVADGRNCADTAFKNLKGYNWVWHTLEFVRLTRALLSLQSGAQLELAAIKAELVDLTGNTIANNALIYGATDSDIRIGSVFIGGDTCILQSSGNAALMAGQLRTTFDVGTVEVTPTAAASNFFVFGGSAANGNRHTVRTAVRRPNQSFPVPLTNLASTDTAQGVTVRPWRNDLMSTDKGDSDYTLVYGEAASILYATPFTASRILTLPSAGDETAAMEITVVVSSGVLSSGVTLAIRSGTRTITTVTSASAQTIRLKWTRSTTAQAGWRVVSVSSPVVA